LVGVFEMVIGNGDGTVATGGAFGAGGGRSFSTGPPSAVLSDAGFADSLCNADDARGVALDGIAGIAGSPCDAAKAVGGGLRRFRPSPSPVIQSLPCGAARAVTPDAWAETVSFFWAAWSMRKAVQFEEDAAPAGSPGSSCDVRG
jgi:hypothetical protein